MRITGKEMSGIRSMARRPREKIPSTARARQMTTTVTGRFTDRSVIFTCAPPPR